MLMLAAIRHFVRIFIAITSTEVQLNTCIVGMQLAPVYSTSVEKLIVDP